MTGYPQEVNYWICSDGRTFSSKKEAVDHENFIERNLNASNASYSAAVDLNNTTFGSKLNS